jgi:hypothetical protein
LPGTLECSIFKDHAGLVHRLRLKDGEPQALRHRGGGPVVPEVFAQRGDDTSKWRGEVDGTQVGTAERTKVMTSGY